jgi:hypothetical protein
MTYFGTSANPAVRLAGDFCQKSAVICRPIEIRRERQFSNDASYQLIGG